ncbi:polyprenol monophosphomannose synthase [Fidelibacter multiformis]|uniref:polyprenol monophosphomannose synthase n=1 Tax=Fidelibacter multiformis TaxID=3377529 RepID=UPI0037DC7FA3
MKRIVIIPTYNEIANVGNLIRDIRSLELNPLDILIVDDNSPDGTADLIRNMQKNDKGLHLIVRPGKLGLGTAYIKGFHYALDHGYDLIAQMDADYSHDPKDLVKLFKAAEEYDWVIGSRYVTGINVVNWPLNRLILSYGANWYTRLITGLPIKDGTAGFKCWQSTVLKNIDLDTIKSQGYSFQIEMNFRAWKKGYRFHEVPIIFVDRTVGQSKMSKKIIREAVLMVWKLKFNSLFHRS